MCTGWMCPIDPVQKRESFIIPGASVYTIYVFPQITRITLYIAWWPVGTTLYEEWHNERWVWQLLLCVITYPTRRISSLGDTLVKAVNALSIIWAKIENRSQNRLYLKSSLCIYVCMKSMYIRETYLDVQLWLNREMLLLSVNLREA